MSSSEEGRSPLGAFSTIISGFVIVSYALLFAKISHIMMQRAKISAFLETSPTFPSRLTVNTSGAM